RALETRPRGEVGRLDDQRVAFPAARGVTRPLPDVRGRMRLAIEGDHAIRATAVSLLVIDHHRVRPLHDPGHRTVPADAGNRDTHASLDAREIFRVVHRATDFRALLRVDRAADDVHV